MDDLLSGSRRWSGSKRRCNGVRRRCSGSMCRGLGSRSHVPVSPRGESTWWQRRGSSRSLNFTARCCLTAGSLTNSHGYRQIEPYSGHAATGAGLGPTHEQLDPAGPCSPPAKPVFNSDFALLEQVLEDLLSNSPSLSDTSIKCWLVRSSSHGPLLLSGHTSMRPRHTPGPWRNSRRPVEAWSAGSA